MSTKVILKPVIRRIARFPLRLFCEAMGILLTYGGGIFVKRPEQPERDTGWEVGRERIFKYGIDYWADHLAKLGLNREGVDVLEVGSGNGQWLIAFTRFARRVCGIEPGDAIYAYSKERIKEFGVEHRIEVKRAGAEKIPYGDAEFDLLFCSGVFMFTRQGDALNEFHRVLRPGGTLLVTANGLGYFIMYLLDGMRYVSKEKTKYGLMGVFNTWAKWSSGKQFGTTAVSHTEMRKMLEMHGFELTETRVWLAQDLYPYEHLGFVTNYAFIARKPC